MYIIFAFSFSYQTRLLHRDSVEKTVAGRLLQVSVCFFSASLCVLYRGPFVIKNIHVAPLVYISGHTQLRGHGGVHVLSTVGYGGVHSNKWIAYARWKWSSKKVGIRSCGIFCDNGNEISIIMASSSAYVSSLSPERHPGLSSLPAEGFPPPRSRRVVP